MEKGQYEKKDAISKSVRPFRMKEMRWSVWEIKIYIKVCRVSEDFHKKKYVARWTYF